MNSDTVLSFCKWVIIITVLVVAAAIIWHDNEEGAVTRADQRFETTVQDIIYRKVCIDGMNYIVTPSMHDKYNLTYTGQECDDE